MVSGFRGGRVSGFEGGVVLQLLHDVNPLGAGVEDSVRVRTHGRLQTIMVKLSVTLMVNLMAKLMI